MDSHQDFALSRNGLLDLSYFEHIGQTISVACQRFHRGDSVNSGPLVVYSSKNRCKRSRNQSSRLRQKAAFWQAPIAIVP